MTAPPALVIRTESYYSLYPQPLPTVGSASAEPLFLFLFLEEKAKLNQ